MRSCLRGNTFTRRERGTFVELPLARRAGAALGTMVLVAPIILALILVPQRPARAGDGLSVTGVVPTPNSMHARVDTAIRVTFDRPVDENSITCDEAFWAFGRWSGKVDGRYVVSNEGRTVSLFPESTLVAGEHVIVILAGSIAAVDGTTLREGGYSFEYWTRVEATAAEFSKVLDVSTNVSGESSRPYGGAASDFNNDGFPDLALVNEDTSDVRMMLNPADCSAALAPVLTPVTPTGQRGSPNESADFDRDGNIDLCVANVSGGSVSILLGNGDGTFQPHQEVPSGTNAHGIAVLDADGDGDLDIAVSNEGTSDIGLLLNDGHGAFGPATFFDGGVDGEWTMATSDMDLDGRFDLVVASRAAGRIAICFGNGDGTFTTGPATDVGGQPWMLVIGDVDNDGFPDVSTANGHSNSGSIIRNVAGVLQAPAVYPSGAFSVATDLGDLDGDGDLDWITSSFFGDYTLYENTGDGTYEVSATLTPPQSGSCCLMVDLDLDDDLDLVLIDELADVVSIYRNGDDGDDCNASGTPDRCEIEFDPGLDCNGNGVLDRCDIDSGYSLDADDNGVPDECETALAACAPGAVNAACGVGRRDVLFVNGDAGATARQVFLRAGKATSLGIVEAPANRCDGAPSRCCIYGWIGSPETSDIIRTPGGLGDMCYGPVFLATELPRVTWNSLGIYGRLGPDDAPGDAPLIPDGGTFELAWLPDGVGRTVIATFQGLIEDRCSRGQVEVSVTNGFTLFVR